MPRQVKKLLLYVFVHPGFYMDRLVRHHEAFAEVGPRPRAHLAGGVLDFTDDEAGGVPVSKRNDAKTVCTGSGRQKSPHRDASLLLLNLLIRVAPVQGQVGFDLKVNTTRLEHMSVTVNKVCLRKQFESKLAAASSPSPCRLVRAAERRSTAGWWEAVEQRNSSLLCRPIGITLRGKMWRHR